MNAVPRARAAHLKGRKALVTATLVAMGGDAAQWWRVTAFSENAHAEIMHLSEGDALSVQGELKVEEYEKDGQKRVSLTVVAGHILALRQPPKPRENLTPSLALDEVLGIMRMQLNPEDRTFQMILRAKSGIIATVLTNQVRVDEAKLRSRSDEGRQAILERIAAKLLGGKE